MKVFVGLPAYNEEAKIASIIAKLQKLSYAVIVCNDGSSDMTGEISSQMGATVINHPRNLGYGAAIRSIFNKAKEIECDVLVTLDADGQHDVNDISQILEPIKKGEADIVIGSRFSGNERSNIPKYREIGIKAITKLTNSSAQNKVTDAQSGFRAYSKTVLKEISPSDTGMGISTEILIKANKKNFKMVEVPIVVSYEGETSTHNPVYHGFSVMLSTMKFVSIEHPLRFYAIPGIFFLVLGLSFFVMVSEEFTKTGRVESPNLALVGIGSVIVGMILFSTAIQLYTLISVVRENQK